MRAVSITKAGGPEVLTVTDHPVRAAGPGEVRIAVKAAAVNPTDILMRENPEVYAKGSPGIPGMDAAGVIESVGEGVERLKVGDEVMAVVTPRRPEGGAQIELLVVPAADDCVFHFVLEHMRRGRHPVTQQRARVSGGEIREIQRLGDIAQRRRASCRQL